MRITIPAHSSVSMRSFHVSLLTLSLLIVACASNVEQGTVTSGATPLPSPDVVSPPNSVLYERVTTPAYEISIDVDPELLQFPALAQELTRYVQEVKRVNDLPSATADVDDAVTASLPWTLTVSVSTQARTSRLLSGLAQEYVYTGGAHGNGAFVSFLYDSESARLLSVSDLFARDVASDMKSYVKQALLRQLGNDVDMQMLEAGIDSAQALDVFTLAPVTEGASAGLVFHYAPHQVAPYAVGTQSVTVPTSVFAANLKPEYRAEFR